MLRKTCAAFLVCLLPVSLALAGDTRTSSRGATGELCIHELTPGATDNFIGVIPAAATLINVWCIATGTINTAATVDISECSSTGTGCAANTTSAMTCDATGAIRTAFAGAEGDQLDAGDWMQATITNTSTTVGILTVCLRYREN